MRGRTRLLIVGLVLALFGAVGAAWPRISAERRFVQSFQKPPEVLARAFPGTSNSFISKPGYPPRYLIGFEVRGRWSQEFRTRVLWSETGWRVVEIERVTPQIAIGRFWSEGKPDAAYRFEMVKNGHGRGRSEWEATLLSHSSPHHPKALPAPDAPWLDEGREWRDWLNEQLSQ